MTSSHDNFSIAKETYVTEQWRNTS